MHTSTFTFQADDGAKIYVYKWIPEGPVRSVVQIAHGMAEHANRYVHVAEVLSELGFAVYANDHRGHGKTANTRENLGHFADKNGWELVVYDMLHLTKIVKQEYPDVPVILLGHSMGSILSKSYIQNYGEELAGVILSGTNADQGLISYLGIFVAKCEMKVKGKRAKSRLLNKLSFGSFNKLFQPNHTEFDWLTRDEQVVDQYVSDPYCGGIVSAAFFYDLLSGIKQIEKSGNMSRIPKHLPVLIIAGEDDPVGGYTKLVRKTINNFEKAGIQDLQYKFYPGARHELFNEINKEEVLQDAIEWMNERIYGFTEMKDKMYFSVETFVELDSDVAKPENYKYWIPLMNYFLQRSDEIEIHCWNDEGSVISEMDVKIGCFLHQSVEGNMTIFKGNLTDDIVCFLLDDYLDKDGRLKWFSIFLNKSGKQLFSSEHWGTEFLVSNVREGDVTLIHSIMPNGTNYYRYE